MVGFGGNRTSNVSGWRRRRPIFHIAHLSTAAAMQFMAVLRGCGAAFGPPHGGMVYSSAARAFSSRMMHASWDSSCWLR